MSREAVFDAAECFDEVAWSRVFPKRGIVGMTSAALAPPTILTPTGMVLDTKRQVLWTTTRGDPTDQYSPVSFTAINVTSGATTTLAIEPDDSTLPVVDFYDDVAGRIIGLAPRDKTSAVTGSHSSNRLSCGWTSLL